MKSFVRYSIYAFLCLSLVVCNPSESRKSSLTTSTEDYATPTGEILISGAYSLYPVVIQWVDAYTKAYPGVRMQVEKSGTGMGIDALLAGKVQLAMISRELNQGELERGLFQIPVAKDAVILIINSNNPYLETILSKGIDPRKLVELYTSGVPFTWGQVLGLEAVDPVRVLTRADASGAAEIFANFMLKSQSELKGETVTGDEEMIELVSQNPGSIGFCNLVYAYNSQTGEQIPGIQVVPLDMDLDGIVDRSEQPYETLGKIHRAMWLGLYPKNLCRRLSFVCMGPPEDRLQLHFLEWVLQDGQEMIEKSGCCQFNSVEIKNSLQLMQ